MDPNVFETANAGFAQAMYEEFLRDPAAVGPEWRRLFESGVVGENDGGAAGQRGGGSTPGSSEAEASQRPLPRCPAAPRMPCPAAPLYELRRHWRSPIKGPAAKLVANMNESLTVPTATTFRELPVAALEERRRALNAALQAAGRREKISFTHLIAYAIVQATKQQPVMGHTLVMRDGVPHRVQPEGIALGLAVDVQRKDGSRGLVVPVIKRAETMDFASLPRGLRDAGREGAHQQADAGRLRRRHHVAHQPRRARHGGIGAPAHGRPGKHHRGRCDRLPGGVLHPAGEAGAGAGHQQGHDDHQHLRSPGHPGRRVGRVPRAGGSPAAGRREVLRADRREPPGYRPRPLRLAIGQHQGGAGAGRIRRCCPTWPPPWRW